MYNLKPLFITVLISTRREKKVAYQRRVPAELLTVAKVWIHMWCIALEEWGREGAMGESSSWPPSLTSPPSPSCFATAEEKAAPAPPYRGALLHVCSHLLQPYIKQTLCKKTSRNLRGTRSCLAVLLRLTRERGGGIYLLGEWGLWG